MTNSTQRTYSHYAQQAITLLGKLIRANRTTLKMTASEVAERAGISRGLLQRIEKGAVTSEIGAVFEVATIVGIPLFHPEKDALNQSIHDVDEKLALLPKSVRQQKKRVRDDF